MKGLFLQLKADDFALTLAPKVGGSVAAFTHKGRDILRPLPAGVSDPLQGAGFPLFPFSGRIDHGRFSFGGAAHTLPPNFLPEPHAIHGQAWQAVWDVAVVTDNAATLVYQHAGDVWPWPYRAEQTFTLHEGGLALDLALTNLGTSPMPAGLGWHPYFPAAGAQLKADVRAIWLSGADMIPAAPEPLNTACDITHLRDVAALDLDNNFTAGPVGAHLMWADGLGVHMRAEGLPHLVVYTPLAETFFCVEPVSHAPNAVNSDLPPSATGLQILSPAQTVRGRIEMLVTKA